MQLPLLIEQIESERWTWVLLVHLREDIDIHRRLAYIVLHLFSQLFHLSEQRFGIVDL